MKGKLKYYDFFTIMQLNHNMMSACVHVATFFTRRLQIFYIFFYALFQ